MAAVQDLTWQQVQTELTAMGYADAIVVTGGKVMIDVGIITGEDADALTDSGVTEFIYKFRQGAGRAQITVNEPIVDPAEQLSSFPPFSYSAPTEEGFVGVTQVSSFIIPLDLNTILGTNN
ncbi:hypothetical protein [Nodularia chucula]|uniref:hypothetical protein n=1 Tax=Nodularia chucula TaxID=3093667 RepID=UPI0039C6CA36